MSKLGMLGPGEFAEPAGAADRRRGPRLKAHRPVMVMPCACGAGLRFQPAQLVDCSRHGVAILLPQPLPADTQFMLKARLRHPVLLIYTVKNCHGAEEEYRIGARFSGIIGPPSDREALAVLDALLEGDPA
jgi:hypothetical protein